MGKGWVFKVFEGICNPKKIIICLDYRGKLNWLHDKAYLKLVFWARMDRRLNLKDPKTFNEKLQWLKLYNRKPEYTVMVDKYAAKEYVSNIIGSEYVTPTLGVWDSFEQIDFDALPKQFVLKCTHDSGGLVICKDKEKLDYEYARKKITKCLKQNYYFIGREWPYKNVKPRIIAEKYMVDASGDDLKDYKFFCFDGVPRLLLIASDRQKDTDTCFDFYDMNFKHLPFKQGHPNAKQRIEKPSSFGLMYELAEKLSFGIPHVRIDFYEVEGQPVFGEMTFFHFGGMTPFEPDEWDDKIGSMLKIC